MRGAGRARAALAAVLGAATAALWAAGLGAQELDAGQLQVNEDGRRAAIERFRVWRAGNTINAVATIELDRGGEWQVGIQLDADLLPLKYELQGAGAPRVSGERFSDRVRFHIIAPEGERWKEFPSRDFGGVLEQGVAHHYLVLVRVLREAPGRSVTIVVPSLGEAAAARLVGESEDQVAVGERTVAATRYDLEVGGERRSVWFDAEDRLLRVLDPATGREAVRLPAR